jgi:hypothetical protein
MGTTFTIAPIVVGRVRRPKMVAGTDSAVAGDGLQEESVAESIARLANRVIAVGAGSSPTRPRCFRRRQGRPW